jgi:hypothetical protein
VSLPGFGCGLCLAGGGRSRGAARGARVHTGSDRAGSCLLSCRWDGLCWSGWCGQGAEPLPAGEEGVGPWPVGADREGPLPGPGGEAGGDVPDPVASLNLEMIMVLGEADGGLRPA